jgi:hypothetical protein
MPYVSDAQRRWAHTDAGTKALGGPSKVAEWDKATKGKDLPERIKMANGGSVNDLPPEKPIAERSIKDLPKEETNPRKLPMTQLPSDKFQQELGVPDYIMKNPQYAKGGPVLNPKPSRFYKG